MGRKQLRHRQHRHHHRNQLQVEEDPLPSSAFDAPIIAPSTSSPTDDDTTLECSATHDTFWDRPNKHELYQLAVQSPKGDISYLQKFFLTYIGGRSPIHLREDFCGTALICAEWLRGGTQRLATGIDLDFEALSWGLQHNIEKLGADIRNRIRLLHGNVLCLVSDAQLVGTPTCAFGCTLQTQQCLRNQELMKCQDSPLCQNEQRAFEEGKCGQALETDGSYSDDLASTNLWPKADIVCAFNYSCCCLQKRSDLILYLKHALQSISQDGGIFVMDLYGGMSSECSLKVYRHFGNFTYIWEQDEFDVITRTSRISLHFRLKNNQVLRHAFTYRFRLWSLPEVRDCLEEVGFDSIHFWMRSMPEMQGQGEQEIEDNDARYEEMGNFNQQDAWNAYIVAVRKRQC